MAESLTDAYRRCQALHRRHGRSYYLATRLLPAWNDAFRAGDLRDPLLPAVLHTIEVFRLDRADFDRFLGAMAMDLTVRRYRGYDELLEYMGGSAAAIGAMMLPILLAGGGPGQAADNAGRTGGAGGRTGGAGGRTAGAAAGRAREPARQLGLAFQLTNFIRDVAEDLRRDRVYLPLDDLDRFGVSVDDLRRCARHRAATPPVRALIRFEVDRAREHYALAAPGVTMLPTASQACIRAAYRLYGGILGEVARAGYDVFAGRARVSVPRRLAVAATSLATPPGRPVSHFDL
jgi:phytoene synthase